MLEVLEQKWTRCRQASVPNEAFAVKAVGEMVRTLNCDVRERPCGAFVTQSLSFKISDF